MRVVLSLVLLSLTAWAIPVAGQDVKPSLEKNLVLDARPAPRPALKHRLFPAANEQTPGNAAVVYYRAMLPEAFTHRRTPQIDEKLNLWRSAPLDKLPLEELAWLRTYAPLKEADVAARRDQCDWELLERVRRLGFATPLAEVQSLRELNRLAILRCRLELSEGKFDEAVYTLRTCISQTRQIGRAPLLICGLVSAACANATLTEIEEFVQTPGAPNLYWALTSLPSPLVDLRPGIEGEMIALESMLPEMSIRDRALTPAEAGAMLERLASAAELMESDGQSSFAKRAMLAATAEGLAPDSRRRLTEAGLSKDLVKSMPAPQAVLLDWSGRYQESFDDQLRLLYLPYWQARTRLEELEKSFKGSEIPLFGQLLPAIARSNFTAVRVERQLAALRTIEALRLYAAAEGKFPAQLADLTDPAPLDPVTGKPFEYRLEGEKARLQAPPPGSEEATTSNSLNYVLSLRKK